MGDVCVPQNGLCTQRDSIFIAPCFQSDAGFTEFKDIRIETALVRTIVKGSKLRQGQPPDRYHIIFPYEWNGNAWVAIPEKKLRTRFPSGYNYLLKYKKELLARDADKNSLWYEFGRSQAIQTVHCRKLLINPYVKDAVITHIVDQDTLTYGGVFLRETQHIYSLEIIDELLRSKEFLKFVKKIGKVLQGGYHVLNTKIIKSFPI